MHLFKFNMYALHEVIFFFMTKQNVPDVYLVRAFQT